MCCGDERTGMKMEWCGTLYSERFSAAAAARTAKVLIVFLALLVMAAGVCNGRMPAVSDRMADSVPAAGTSAWEAGTGMSEAADLTWLLTRMPSNLTDVNEAEAAVPVCVNGPAADVTSDAESIKKEETYPVIMPEDIMNTVAGSSAALPSGTAGNTISAGIENAAEPDTGTGVYEEEDPSAVIPPESPSGAPVTEVVNGFLVNESGLIYGIADPDLIVTDGYMELPSEGCSGIAAGTFAAGFPDVREIWIPSNITYFEEGAFTGLTNMEWYEMETSGDCYTEEGVLFSENGSCILAFPAGRTGTYKVPSHVVRFASGAFDSAHLEAVDATACSLTDTSGIPEGIALLVRETP